jgi:signal transduction histidine kinase
MNADASQRRRPWQRPWQLHGVAADALLALGVAALSLAEAFGTQPPTGGPRVISVPGTLLLSGALAWRRRAPLVVLSVVQGSVVGQSLLGGDPFALLGTFVAALVSVYTVAAYCPRPTALAGLAITVAATLVNLLALGRGPSDYLFVAILLLTPWWAGRVLRARLQRVADLTERAVRLEHERDQQAKAAITAERARIARELHDIIAHSVSTMVLQAGAAEQILGQQPDRVGETLRSIQGIGRQALVDISRLLGVLREGGQEVGLTPQPTVDDVATLVAQARQAGLAVDLAVEGQARPIPPGVGLSAYRIVQEAITNARRHAGPAHVQVTVRYATDTLELEVVDDGRGPPPDADGGSPGGHGLVGMRERVTLYGGTLQVGPRPGGGFAVQARLPTGAPA